MVYDKKFKDALMNLSKALDDICGLCDDEEAGEQFNNEILASDKLLGCFAKSLDEIATEVAIVANEMNVK